MKLNQKTDALVVIDVQNDFALPTGALYVKNGIDITAPIANMCSRFENIFFTQDNHTKNHKSFASTHNKNPFEVIEMYGHEQVLWPDHCVIGSFGSEIIKELRDEYSRAKAIIRKGMNPLVDSYSAFCENFSPDGGRTTTGFAGLLHELGIKRIFFVGLARDYCVKFSAVDAVCSHFESYIIDDCTCSVNNDGHVISSVTKELLDAGVRIVNSKEIDL